MTGLSELLLNGFDPRLRDGGDRHTYPSIKDTQRFDPRLRDGGDGLPFVTLSARSRFDPRLRDGGDLMDAGTGPGPDMFRSTPP